MQHTMKLAATTLWAAQFWMLFFGKCREASGSARVRDPDQASFQTLQGGSGGTSFLYQSAIQEKVTMTSSQPET